MKRHHLFVAVLATIVVAAMAGRWWWWLSTTGQRNLLANVAMIVPPPSTPGVPCPAPGPGFLRLLILGQSNAGSHGAEEESPADSGPPFVLLLTERGCQLVGDPLPGSTGRHRSIWTSLEPAFRELGRGDRLAIALLAVDSSRIEDWTSSSSPLNERLQHLLAKLREHRFEPDLVLWQQGESDARQGTDAQAYATAFERLRHQLRRGGVTAPVLLARSTRCRSKDGASIRRAQDLLIETHADLRAGPDTDRLDGTLRNNDCHFTRGGLKEAARLWADTIDAATR